jgi:hypothetical protein
VHPTDIASIAVGLQPGKKVTGMAMARSSAMPSRPEPNERPYGLQPREKGTGTTSARPAARTTFPEPNVGTVGSEGLGNGQRRKSTRFSAGSDRQTTGVTHS